MELTGFILTLFLVTGTRAAFDYRLITEDVQFRREIIGTAYQSCGFARLVTYLDFSKLITYVNNTLETINQIHTICNKLYDMSIKTNLAPFNKCTARLNLRLQETQFERMYTRVLKQFRTIKLFFSPELHKRVTKRSVIPLIGKAMSAGYGLVEEETFSNLKAVVDDLQLGVKKSLTYDEKHSVWINNSLGVFVEELRLNYKNTVEAQSNFAKELREELLQTNIFNALDRLIMDVHIRLVQIKLDLSEIFSLLSHAANDRMYEGVLDVNSIMDKLINIKEKLPAEKTIPFLDSSDIILLFKIVRLEYVKIDQGFHLELKFPIVFTNRTLSLTSYIPVPTRIPNCSDQFIYTPPQYEQYLENVDSHEYYGLSLAEFKHACSRLIYEQYICETSNQFLWKSTETPTATTNHSTTKYFKLDSPLLVETNQPNKYLLLGPADGKISILTDNKETDLGTDHTYDVLCDDNCLIHSGGRTIKPINYKIVAKDIIISYEYIPTNFTYDYMIQAILQNNERLETVGSLLISSSTDPFAKFSATLQNQPNPSHIQLPTDTEYLHQINSFLIDFVKTPIGILSMVALGLVVFFFSKSKSNNQPAGNHTTLVMPKISNE